MYANTTSIFVFGHGVGYTVEKAVEAATTHSDENGARKRKPFASGHKGAKETHMGMTIAQKILKAHLVDGEMVLGQEIGLKIDQTLTQDATGTMAYLQFEAMGVDQVKTERSVAYIDHNTLQSGFENADDHKYIGSVAKKHGIYYSKAGNGICHQVHLERFGAPGKTLIGSDSHTPTGGGIGMLAFGAGGLDVAVAMGGGAYYIPMPKMVRVNLTGKLSPWVDLSALEPLAAMPHMPDNVKKVSEIGEIKVNQCCIGSCTNSSYYDMMKVASILKGKTVSPEVSLTISPGSKQVFNMLAQNGALADIISAGARILECACGPCIGMGQSPESGGVSLRTFNRNFEGRSGTQDAQIFLVSPEVAAASALTGVLTDPRTLGEMPQIEMPEHFTINDNMIVKPAENPAEVEVVRGPNIKPFPLGKALEASYTGKVVLKTEDNITTDHILPAGAKLLPYRSNVPYYSNYCFINVDPEFPSRCKEQGGGVIVGGANYGQGSSREHAALVPLYLGVKAVLCKSFARIHKANLVNSGIIPLTFADSADYDAIKLLDNISLPNVLEEVKNGEQVTVVCGGKTFKADCEVSERQRHALLAGGTLLYARQQNK